LKPVFRFIGSRVGSPGAFQAIRLYWILQHVQPPSDMALLVSSTCTAPPGPLLPSTYARSLSVFVCGAAAGFPRCCWMPCCCCCCCWSVDGAAPCSPPRRCCCCVPSLPRCSFKSRSSLSNAAWRQGCTHFRLSLDRLHGPYWLSSISVFYHAPFSGCHSRVSDWLRGR
jgi:hypothetical protein